MDRICRPADLQAPTLQRNPEGPAVDTGCVCGGPMFCPLNGPPLLLRRWD